jgi:hypothetical protein
LWRVAKELCNQLINDQSHRELFISFANPASLVALKSLRSFSAEVEQGNYTARRQEAGLSTGEHNRKKGLLVQVKVRQRVMPARTMIQPDDPISLVVVLVTRGEAKVIPSSDQSPTRFKLHDCTMIA